MSSSENIIQLLNAIKKNDQETIDKITKNFIRDAEKKGHHQIAKKLREIYSEPYGAQIGKNSGFFSSSFSGSAHSGPTLYEIRNPKVGLDNVILSKKNRKIVQEIVRTYSNRNKLKELNLPIENNIFVYGPPGTGKTLLAYSLAGELDLPVFHVYLDSLISSYLGETGKNIGKIFSDASKQECVIFLDEFDAIGKMRDDNQDLGELKRVVTVLLQRIDELPLDTILIAATNHDHLIDRAIRRRFNYEMFLDLPDAEARKKLFDLYLVKFGKFNTQLLSDITEGMSGASIRQTINKIVKNWYLDGSKQELFLRLIDGFSFDFLTQRKFDTKDEASMEILSNVILSLREHHSKKYTFKRLEKLTQIPDSTLHGIIGKYGN